jgi:hypothetical protein
MRFRRITAACVLLLAAACQQGPTASVPVHEPAGPAMNGLGFGSGHMMETDSTVVASDSETTTVRGDSSSTGRGLGFGSGH